ALTPPPGEIVRSADEQTLLLNMQGALTLMQPTADQQWRFPLGDKPFHLPDGAVTKMALTPPPGEIVRSADEQTLLLNMQGA
ncbi:phosphate ABC transporter permease, partial [Pantoea agglomerans]|nr:phosphate ABC transporter permease [Pantoea agglomerans]